MYNSQEYETNSETKDHVRSHVTYFTFRTKLREVVQPSPTSTPTLSCLRRFTVPGVTDVFSGPKTFYFLRFVYVYLCLIILGSWAEVDTDYR